MTTIHTPFTPSAADLKHFDQDGLNIGQKQYVQKDQGDTSLADSFWRVASWVARAETPEARLGWAQKFYDLMTGKKFCPGGRVMAGAGSQHGNVLNCFVQGATKNDPASHDGVMEVARKLALVTKVGGGNGVNLDVYAPRSHTSRPDTGVRGWVYISAAHADVNDFIQGLMRPPTQPDGDKVPMSVRNWTRAVYGPGLSAEQILLARQNGVALVQNLPAGTITVQDDMGAIVDAANDVTLQAKAGREPRLDLSAMRPEGAPIRGSGGTSSGPVSFLMEIFDNFLEWANLGAERSGPVNTLRFVYSPVLRVVRQGGSRRGAGMATISVDHPDLLDFLTSKDLDREASEGDISTFNVSILITDAFWNALQADELISVDVQAVPGKYHLVPQEHAYAGQWPQLADRDSDGAHGVPVYHQNGQPAVPAAWIWRQIAEHAWSTGEPGLIFVDQINRHSAISALGGQYVIKSTNPCGEVPLTIGEACDLGAINLAAYVHAGAFDTGTFTHDVHTCVRFLDDVLDVNVFALEDNRETGGNLRRLGLGVMGLADALIRLGLRYDSQEGRNKISEIMTTLRQEAVAESERLAAVRGNYPVYDKNRASMPHAPRRNVAVVTVAPTGTTSMLMGVSSGIEPIYSPFIWRKIGSDYRSLVAPLLVEMLNDWSAEHGVPSGFSSANGQWDWDAVAAALSDNHGSLQGLTWIAPYIRDVFVCAHDIAPLDHVRMQGAIQTAFDEGGQHAANSLSKTINLPNSATVEEIQAAYGEAYTSGCKGVTVYRDGSRQFQVLSTSKEKSDQEKQEVSPAVDAAAEVMGEDAPTWPDVDRRAQAPVQAPLPTPVYHRPARLTGVTDMVKLQDPVSGKPRSFLVTVNHLQGAPIEVMVISGRAGDEANADSEALGRVVSIALQYGVPSQAIMKTLRGLNGGLYGSYNGRLVSSKADLIAVALETFDTAGEKRPSVTAEAAAQPVTLQGAARCPQCEQQTLVREDGCLNCKACHYSKCGS